MQPGVRRQMRQVVNTRERREQRGDERETFELGRRERVEREVVGSKSVEQPVLTRSRQAREEEVDDGQEVAIRHPDIRRAKLVLTDALIEATASPPRTN